MTEALRVRPGITFTPLPSPVAAEPSFAIRSPQTGGLLEVSMAVVRVLSAFATGATVTSVVSTLAETDEQRAAITDSALEMTRLGLLTPVGAPPPPAQLPPIFVLSGPGSVAVKLQEALNAHPSLAATPLASIIQSSHQLHERCWTAGVFGVLKLKRPEQLRPIRAAVDATLGQFALRRQKSAWVYNSRDLDQHLHFTDELFEGQARYLAVVRNPLDTVHTLAASFDAYRTTISAASGLEGLLRAHPAVEVALAHYWVGLHSRIRKFRQAVGARLHVVRSENLDGLLLSVELFKAFQSLGLPWAPPEPDSTPAPRNAGRQDPAATMVRTLANVGAGAWKKAWTPELIAQTVDIVREEAEAWGYSLAKAGSSK